MDWKPTSAFRVTRRDFLRTGTAAAIAFTGVGRINPAFSQSTLPAPEASGIDHIVVVMMENRSFDHMLGWHEGADGRQAGLRYTDRSGVVHRTHRLAPDFQGCGHPDPDHSFDGGRVELNSGACDGWLRAGNNDEFAIGYYAKRDLAFFGPAASRWTTCDRYFCSIMAETFPNRIYQYAAQTDRLTNTTDLCTLTTIWDRLAASGLTGRYYFSDVPTLALWGPKYLGISTPIAQFYVDAQLGTLPHVAFVDPRFLGADLGLSEDDHPHADIRKGQAFMNRVYRAVTTGQAWPRTALVFNYDEWGGFFEHVAPPTVSIPPAERDIGNDGLLGFRVPAVIISPFARREAVSHVQFDHTSILRMIEWRWGLEPLTERDATANNLAEALQFTTPSLQAKQFIVPTASTEVCFPPALFTKWDRLLEVARFFGFPDPDLP